MNDNNNNHHQHCCCCCNGNFGLLHDQHSANASILSHFFAIWSSSLPLFVVFCRLCLFHSLFFPLFSVNKPHEYTYNSPTGKTTGKNCHQYQLVWFNILVQFVVICVVEHSVRNEPHLNIVAYDAAVFLALSLTHIFYLSHSLSQSLSPSLSPSLSLSMLTRNYK